MDPDPDPDQPVPEIRKFLQISNGLAKTFNLRYYMPKSGPGSGSTGSGNPEIFADSERACKDLQFEILHAKSEKSGFSGFPDPDPVREPGIPSGRHQTAKTKP